MKVMAKLEPRRSELGHCNLLAYSHSCVSVIEEQSGRVSNQLSPLWGSQQIRAPQHGRISKLCSLELLFFLLPPSTSTNNLFPFSNHFNLLYLTSTCLQFLPTSNFQRTARAYSQLLSDILIPNEISCLSSIEMSQKSEKEGRFICIFVSALFLLPFNSLKPLATYFLNPYLRDLEGSFPPFAPLCNLILN